MMKLLLTGIFLTELVKYGLWLRGVLEVRFTRWRYGCIVAGICFFLIGIGVVNEDSLLILWNLAAIAVFSIMIECDKGEKILLVVKTTFIVISIGEIVGGLIQIISDESIIKVNKTAYFLGNLVTVLLFVVLGKIKKWISIWKIMKTGKLYRGVVYGAIILVGSVIFFVVTGLQSIAKIVVNEKLHIFSRVVSLVVYICIICLVMIISYIFNENKTYKLYLEKEIMLMKLQKNMYDTMLLKNEETKRFRHDMKNHFIYLNELSVRGEINKLQNYIEEITGKLYTIQGEMYRVGNDVVDVVLNYYISMLPTDVVVKVVGVCASNIGISDFELCTVVSNLIQNAEEALKKEGIEKRYLWIEFGRMEGYVLMKIRNSIVRNSVILDKKNGIPKTTKRNKDEHGIGMYNIKETLEKNGGMLDIEVSMDEYSVMVMFPLVSL